MRKRVIAITAILIVLVFSASMVSMAQPRLSVHVNGGLGWLLIGDTNANLKALNAYYRDLSKLGGGSQLKLYDNFHFNQVFDGDLSFRIYKQWEIGAGVGILLSGKDDNEVQISDPPRDETLSHEVNVKFLTASIGYRFPLMQKLSILARIGGGYYFANWTEEGWYSEADGSIPGYWREWDLDADGSSLGVHGSIGLEYPLFKWLAIVLEGFGRYAKINGFQGDGHVVRASGSSSTVTDGTLYQFEYYDGYTNQWYRDVNLLDAVPSGPERRDVREAELDLSGVEVKLGLAIRLF